MFDAKDATRIRPVAHRDERPEGLADEPLRPGHAGPLRVRRVAEQEVDALVAELGQPADVGLQPVDRRVVELPVAGVDDAAGGRVEHDGDAVRDRVRDADEVEAERADLDRPAPGSTSRSVVALASPCSSSFDLTRPSVSFVPITSSQSDLAQEVRQPADVILVRVREHDRVDAPALGGTRCRAGRGRRRGARRAGTRAPRRRRRDRRRARTPSCSCRPRRGRRAG